MSTKHVELFVAWAVNKYKLSTLQSTVDALAAWCKEKGATPDPVRGPTISLLLKTAKATCGPEGLTQGKPGLPLPMLKALVAYLGSCKSTEPAFQDLHTRDIAWLFLGFFGMLRRSELIGLRLQDVQLVGPGPTKGHISLFIARSKTDRQGVGATVRLSGLTGQGWDIWTPIKRYLVVRRAAGAEPQDAFLAAWDLDNMCLGNKPLKTTEALGTRLHALLQRLSTYRPGPAQFDAKAYSMHSLRRGGVMAALAAGVELPLIKLHGRWKSDHGMRPYITPDVQTQLRVTSKM